MITTAKRELAGERVRFTPLQMENIYKHFAWNNDPELNMLDSELPYVEESFGEFKRRFEEMLEHPEPNSQDFEVHAEDGTLIGVAEMTHISEHNRHCNLTLTICDRAYWGKGYGRDAMQALLAYCFRTLRMHRVMAEAFDYNDAWKRLVEGMGFKKEGTLRDFVFRQGRYWDKHVYALLESEYRA
ncbi:GNAT family N-acetyltransferase [Rhodocaloribacter litoris]|uniref:GNAT family N-acetyltransferase n=1 Tax=Rhodocaloribacter litoris TaxID=2558931 RepID=UPI00141ED451|nr:GNAT family protein [Rhodocaloribacter litoris]QXD15259.1 GNAT family N-acetyltransferase [Rhodocaloribacter litoris]